MGEVIERVRKYFRYLFLKKRHSKKRNIWSSTPAVTQRFSFPMPLINYIHQGGKTRPKAGMKLQQCCKFFSQRINIVELQVISNECWFPMKSKVAIFVNDQRIDIAVEKLFSRPETYYLPEYLTLHRRDSNDRIFFTQLLSKILTSNLKQVFIRRMHMTFKEYQLLTASADFISLQNCQILDENDEMVPVPELIPWESPFNIFWISTDELNCSPEMYQELASKRLKFLPNKKISIYFFGLPLDTTPNFFADFLLNNQNKNLTLTLEFLPTNRAEIENFKSIINEKIKDLPDEKKPVFHAVEKLIV